MNFIKNTFVYLLLLVFDVKTIVNDAEKLENCASKVGRNLLEKNEDNSNLLKLIDQSTVILKAFCSENLINFIDDDYDDDDDDSKRAKNNDNFSSKSYENDFEERKTLLNKLNSYTDIKSDDNDSLYSDSYDDDDDEYVYKSADEKKLKTLITFTPLTIYKGVHIMRQLELFNNQEYFQIKG
jgi:hypothetical protein